MRKLLAGILAALFAVSSQATPQPWPADGDKIPFEVPQPGAKDLKTYCAPTKPDPKVRKPPDAREPPQFHICRLTMFLHYVTNGFNPSYEVIFDPATWALQLKLDANLMPTPKWDTPSFGYIFSFRKPTDGQWKQYAFCSKSERFHHRTPGEGGWNVRFNFIDPRGADWAYFMGGAMDDTIGTTGVLDVGIWIQTKLILRSELQAAKKANACQ